MKGGMLLKLRGKGERGLKENRKWGTSTHGKQEMKNGNNAENSFSFSFSL